MRENIQTSRDYDPEDEGIDWNLPESEQVATNIVRTVKNEVMKAVINDMDIFIMHKENVPGTEVVGLDLIVVPVENLESYIHFDLIACIRNTLTILKDDDECANLAGSCKLLTDLVAEFASQK